MTYYKEATVGNKWGHIGALILKGLRERKNRGPNTKFLKRDQKGGENHLSLLEQNGVHRGATWVLDAKTQLTRAQGTRNIKGVNSGHIWGNYYPKTGGENSSVEDKEEQLCPTRKKGPKEKPRREHQGEPRKNNIYERTTIEGSPRQREPGREIKGEKQEEG